MRTFSLALTLSLPACAGATNEAPRGDAIDCALDGGSGFAKVCTVEAIANGFIVNRPDGGFRRFEIASHPGVRVVVESVDAADGADHAKSTQLADGRTEIEIGKDRYRLRVVYNGPT